MLVSRSARIYEVTGQTHNPSVYHSHSMGEMGKGLGETKGRGAASSTGCFQKETPPTFREPWKEGGGRALQKVTNKVLLCRSLRKL